MERLLVVAAFALALLLPWPLVARGAAGCDRPIGPPVVAGSAWAGIAGCWEP